jgi:hypothetical protein
MSGTKKSGETQAKQPAKVKLLKNGMPPDIGKKTQFKPGQSGNPAGPKPGYKHISTHIRELLEDDKFEGFILDNAGNITNYKGKPMKAILRAMAIKAMAGDTRAFEALAKHGYGINIMVEPTSAEASPYAALTTEELRQLARGPVNAGS